MSALIGYGFMGRTHSNAYRQVNNFFDLEYQPVLKAICDVNEEKAKAFAAHGATNRSRPTGGSCSPARTSTWSISACPTTCTREIAIAAAKAGKMIICEKPLARDGRKAEQMVEAVEKAGVPNMVSYNYRRVPAVTLAKQLIDEGRLGPHLPLPRQLPPGLDHLRGPAAGRRRASGGWTSRWPAAA